MNLHPYSYCLLRYVGNLVYEEFANVGVLLWSPDLRHLEFRACPNYGRLSKFFPDFESEDYRGVVNRLQTQFEQLAKQLADPQAPLPFVSGNSSARELAAQVLPVDDGALQWSLSRGGLAPSLTDEFQRIYQDAVGRYYERKTGDRRDDATVYRDVYRSAFEAQDIKHHFTEHTIEAALAQHNFPKAWKNGLWNVYETVSFDLEHPESIYQKAYRWDSQAKFLSASREKFKMHLLLGAPREELLADYANAKEILHDSRQIHLIEEDEAPDFAKKLSREIQQANLS